MTEPVIQMIHVNLIKPSPFQHRRKFHGIADLAENIKRDGLIEPIVVRKAGDFYELIAGERRLRAVSTIDIRILCRVVEATDLQARRMCASENMQREGLSAEEEIEAIVEMIDAELFDFEDYASFGEDARQRVKFLLGKLDSDYKNGTGHFRHKFMSKVETIFSGLPAKKEWRSFYVNDLPLLNIPDPVKEIAIDNKLNKSQTKAVAKLYQEDQQAFQELASKANAEGVITFDMDDDGEEITLSNVSAKEIKGRSDSLAKQIPKSTGSFHVSTKENDWYTPSEYIESARAVMGGIDLDPASSDYAQQTVKALKYYTKEQDGLAQVWSGRVWMNPPYSMPEIKHFVDKLLSEDVSEWIVLTNNSSDTAWFHSLLKNCDLLCLPKGRVGFINPDSDVMATRQGQTIFYRGKNTDKFGTVFSEYGAIMSHVNP